MDAHPATGPNEPIDVPVRLLNRGAAVDDVEVVVYMSADAILTDADREIARGRTAVPAAPSTLFTMSSTVPGDLVPGDYFTIAVVDPQNELIEADEQNNVGVSGTTGVLRGADLVAVEVCGSLGFRTKRSVLAPR